jgi:hypothetical protein
VFRLFEVEIEAEVENGLMPSLCEPVAATCPRVEGDLHRVSVNYSADEP